MFADHKPFKIDSIEIEPISVDHSLPGVSGFIIHTSNGLIGYTADIRFHGRRQKDSEEFVENCSNSDLKILLCEGTQI
jgi:ribonuclease J